uniref:Putative capsid protein n=1 Tax=Soybean thrips virus 4 TaxID=2796558 RepID=A0A7T3R0M4_9VIRU|nr:putative capsid protein [Soybean thrips virus 4]
MMLRLLMLVAGVGAYATDTCDVGPVIECDKLGKPSEIARCAATRFDCGLMSQGEWERMTHVALKKADPGQTYYSVGIEWGDIASLAMTKQTGYSFDWAMKLPLAMPHYSKAPLYVGDSAMKRPLLVYALGQVTAPTIQREDWWFKKAGGFGRWARVYNLPGAKPVSKLTESCTGLSANADLTALKSRNGMLAVMDPSVWCPKQILKDFDIYIGDLRVRSVNLGGVVEQAYVLTDGEIRSGSDVKIVGKGLRKSVF